MFILYDPECIFTKLLCNDFHNFFRKFWCTKLFENNILNLLKDNVIKTLFYLTILKIFEGTYLRKFCEYAPKTYSRQLNFTLGAWKYSCIVSRFPNKTTSFGPQMFIVKSLIISNTDNHPIYIKTERRGKGPAARETERVCVWEMESHWKWR